MEFGDRSLFSVQMELDSDYGNLWLYGRFCYWINKSQVGDYDLGTSLRDVLFNMKWILSDRGKRNSGRLCTLSPQEAFLLLDSSLYGTDLNAKESSFVDLPARFEVKPAVDVFDNWKVYLIECRDSDLMLYRNCNESNVQFFSTPVGVFDGVILEVYDHLENLYENQIVL